jgi:hypothetical protein
LPQVVQAVVVQAVPEEVQQGERPQQGEQLERLGLLLRPA